MDPGLRIFFPVYPPNIPDNFTWIEYSIEKDAAFCLYCYLFKPESRNRSQAGGDAFMATGFKNWKKKQDLLNQSQHIETVLQRQFSQARSEYCVRLKASVDYVRFLLKQGLAFRGHNETANSKNRGNFLELLEFSTFLNKDIKDVLQNAPENNKLTAHVVQKDIVNSFAATLEELFSKHGLGIGRLRGQGYDEASNMRGRFGGLKTLIMNENESAYYVHCFAHQLQLALVGVAKKHPWIALLFNMTSNALNIVGVSCKRRNLLREKHTSKVIQKIQSGDILSGQGLNQETTLKRSGDTLMENALTSEQRGETCALLDQMQPFEFIFNLHLMKDILGITMKVAKQRLNAMRNDGWDSFFVEVSSFCVKNDIIIPNIDDPFVERERSRRRVKVLTNQHYYRVQLFIGCIDLQNQELENCFNEINTKLLLCMACLSLKDLFVAFDKEKLIQLAQFYPRDFSSKSCNAFSELKGIGDLAKTMVETRKNTVYPLVYMLMTLALILPVATAGVERAFPAMNIIKNKLRNRMADDWMNDILVTYIEKDICETIDDEMIMQRFQKMATRRGQVA
ncbi:hypothetical protein AQUCO_02100077v1 [Aquilegia coerulea]|uniref:TTF-type domain-containing protein n=1 Tax=Aquilegia coerulea TaxID=218851 RepID=A0A2G5DEN3_AQUCA|nr:hypothetical protein AQUCO_02100077v1 [Aquilegia coerulea]